MSAMPWLHRSTFPFFSLGMCKQNKSSLGKTLNMFRIDIAIDIDIGIDVEARG